MKLIKHTFSDATNQSNVITITFHTYRRMMLSRPALSRLLQAVSARHIHTGSAAITNPLHYTDGARLQPSNTNEDEQLEILEPHTGKQRIFASHLK